MTGAAFHLVGKTLLLFGGDGMFLPAMISFIIGHVFYLILLIGFLLPLRKADAAILLAPILLSWILPIQMKIEMPMAVGIALVAALLALYVLAGFLGVLRKKKGFVWVLIGGLCFCAADMVTARSNFGGANVPWADIVSEVLFGAAEILIVVALFIFIHHNHKQQ